MIGMEDGVRMLSAQGRRFSRCAPSPRPRNRNLTNMPPPAAVHIRTNDMISPEERRFLEAAELGNKPTLQEFLDYHDGERRLNVNCLDSMGRTALEIAVDNENMEVVELLLQQPDIRIGNALLCAIREGVYRLVEVLVNHPNITKEMLGEGWTQALDPSEAASAEYSSDISPVILAAQLNQFEILQMLIRKDAKIDPPHNHTCICETCDRERLNDSLQYSLKRINTYRALASPAYMSLTSSDPINEAFKLSWALQRLAFEEHEFKETYLQLSEQCKQYSCDLLSQCRSSEEVIAILNKENDNNDNIDLWASKLSLARLKLAIKYEQKAFVSHPHCQQLLTSIWYEGIPYRQQSGTWASFFLYAFLLAFWPVFCLLYILMPRSRLGKLVRSPFMKFFYYSISFATFLGLLTWATFEDYRYEKGERGGVTRASDRGPPATWVESLVFTWVIGMLWSEIKQLWEEGFKRYMRQWWNWLDFLMICLYLCTISIRLSAYYIFTYREDPYRYTVRTHWQSEEPMLVAEALFAVGNVFSFARIIYLFQTNPYLGPLQISLGCMLVDVAKFCFIFVLIISSFSIGLAQLYWYYDPNTDVCVPGSTCRSSTNVFSSIADSYLTLLWSLFSITKPEDTDVIENHKITQWVGQGMFIMYHCTSIIVLLNMLIAMMSHSFQIINDHADLEWKFHRTKLWMAHFDEGSSLPPPFNIIITPKSLINFVNCLLNTVRWLLGKYTYQKNRNRATIRRPGYSRKRNEMEKSGGQDDDSGKAPLTYASIIQRLVARFIHQTKKEMKMDGVNEDDLHEIKQDISSLRYELRDDRRREIVRSSSHIDAVKRDIMRTMSTNSRARVYGGSMRLPKTRPSVAEESEEEDKSDETSSSDEEADETRSRKSSVLYTPPVNSTLPGIISEEAPVRKHPKRRASEADSKLPDRPLSETFTSSFAPKLLPVFAQPPHSALRKTDTSMSFPINGTSLEASIVKPPRGVLRASQENLNTVELMEMLRKEMNEKFDRLISGMVEVKSPASQSHVEFSVDK
ncbi:hypothetical protein L5515_004070 [Caenorhabditis briggsae]|uniref:Transient receptor ion channel domain-containing protein n=2 Tax=Caenorhabditis briggsae TaxID=6238 RepID=A0AAE9EJL2_CAEBR|nr:hypothetical protein L3Y34_001213 [Caenorhabditis briggsae]UMM23266.1 hypothetical protein L5515_004070 [Caenorhabditis briggsae]